MFVVLFVDLFSPKTTLFLTTFLLVVLFITALTSEIINRRGYDYAVDLWSYGVLLYEMCVGERLFGQRSTGGSGTGGAGGTGSMNQTDLFNAITSFVALPQSQPQPSQQQPQSPLSPPKDPIDQKETDIHPPAHDNNHPEEVNHPSSADTHALLSVKHLIAQLLVPIPEDRIGYKDAKRLVHTNICNAYQHIQCSMFNA